MILIKFIFPQNYKYKNKLFGIIDYQSLIFNIIWDFIIFLLSSLFSFSITMKVILFSILCLPILIITIIGFNHENIIYVIIYIIRFYRKNKIYIYKKY